VDKERWLQEQCREIKGKAKENRSQKVYRLLKKIYKKWTPTQSTIKDNNGKILQDEEETKQWWTEYCSELYRDTAKEDTVTPELEAITPLSIDDQGDHILLEEVEKAIKRLKRNKSLGTDGIVGEALQAGGIELTKEIHKTWREGKIPEEWARSIL